MFKNKFLIFIILVLALLTMGVASAEESSLDIADTQDTVVSTSLVNDSGTEAVASEYDDGNSLDVASEDSDNLKSQNVLSAKSDDFEDNAVSTSDVIANSNDVVGLNDNSKTFTDLNATIAGASGTLTLDSDYKMTSDESSNFKSGITIEKWSPITINGNGHTIDANKLGGIFNIATGTGTVTLTNVTLINGKSEYGGAIYSSGNVIVKGANFINNTANDSRIGYGGAIYSNDGVNVVVDCNFDSNYACNYGGAICIDGGGFTVSGCSFVNNSVDNCGGAIFNSCDNLVLAGCSFVINSAD